MSLREIIVPQTISPDGEPLVGRVTFSLTNEAGTAPALEMTTPGDDLITGEVSVTTGAEEVSVHLKPQSEINDVTRYRVSISLGSARETMLVEVPAGGEALTWLELLGITGVPPAEPVIGSFVSPPASYDSPGGQGRLAWDGIYLYRCVASDTWVRSVQETTWSVGFLFSPTSVGTQGQTGWDGTYFYTCVDTNVWVRAAQESIW